MTWLFQPVLQHLTPFQALLVLIPVVGYLLWKYQKRREAKFFEAMHRRERIARRLMEI